MHCLQAVTMAFMFLQTLCRTEVLLCSEIFVLHVEVSVDVGVWLSYSIRWLLIINAQVNILTLGVYETIPLNVNSPLSSKTSHGCYNSLQAFDGVLDLSKLCNADCQSPPPTHPPPETEKNNKPEALADVDYLSLTRYLSIQIYITQKCVGPSFSETNIRDFITKLLFFRALAVSH